MLGGLLYLATSASAASAAGVACNQDCRKKPCAQTLCQQVKPGAAGGFCNCSGAAESWDGTTSSAWCSAWGQPLSACPPSIPLTGPDGGPTVELPVQLANADVLVRTLRSRNPYVATLLNALRDGARWMDGPVQGLIHDSWFDSSRQRRSHSTAIAFTGQVAVAGVDAAQVDITVSGDIEKLDHLKQYSHSATPTAVPPRQIHGTVSAGGAHGSFLVTAADGRSEVIQW
jgi:hypothetical protein